MTVGGAMKLGLALLAMIGCAWPVAAFADERVTLRWTAPAECPTETSVREQVIARLPPGTPLRIDATATRVQGGYHLALTVATETSTGEREVETRDCKMLVSSMAVIAAMAAHEARAAASAKPSEPASPPPPPAPPPPPPPPQRSFRAFVRPEATLDVGTLPTIASGFGVAVGVDLPAALRRLRVEGYGGLSLEQDTIATAGRGASFSIRAAGGRACFVAAEWATVQGRVCAGGEASSVRGAAFGVARTTELSSLVFAARADAMLSAVVLQSAVSPSAGPSLALQLGVGLAVPTRRESFVILPFGAVHERGPLSLRALVGPELRF